MFPLSVSEGLRQVRNARYVAERTMETAIKFWGDAASGPIDRKVIEAAFFQAAIKSMTANGASDDTLDDLFDISMKAFGPGSDEVEVLSEASGTETLDRGYGGTATVKGAHVTFEMYNGAKFSGFTYPGQSPTDLIRAWADAYDKDPETAPVSGSPASLKAAAEFGNFLAAEIKTGRMSIPEAISAMTGK